MHLMSAVSLCQDVMQSLMKAVCCGTNDDIRITAATPEIMLWS
jgi:hypothetical protein